MEPYGTLSNRFHGVGESCLASDRYRDSRSSPEPSLLAAQSAQDMYGGDIGCAITKRLREQASVTALGER
jgi:hypothetical protein